jgi:O-antigen ligase
MYGALVLSAIFLWNPDARGLIAASVGRDPTLTTRTDIWQGAMDLKTNVLFGAGYASVWLTEAGWKLAVALKIPHAHNGYLETYLNSGLIGLILLLALLLAAGRNATRTLREGTALGPLYIALLLTGVIYNYTEVTFNINNVICFSLWLIAVNPPAAAAVRSVAKNSALDSPAHGTGMKTLRKDWRAREVGHVTGGQWGPIASGARNSRPTWNR